MILCVKYSLTCYLEALKRHFKSFKNNDLSLILQKYFPSSRAPAKRNLNAVDKHYLYLRVFSFKLSIYVLEILSSVLFFSQILLSICCSGNEKLLPLCRSIKELGMLHQSLYNSFRPKQH